MLATESDKGVTALDQTRQRILDGDVFNGLEDFRRDMLSLRAELGPEPWEAFARETFPEHPLRALVHESPFSRRSFEQPRGYPGDAVTLDYIYGYLTPFATGRLGQRVFHWEIQTQSCRSVRARRRVLADYIDQTAASVPGARMLAIACGHLREGLTSAAFRDRAFSEFIALDQDEESLRVVSEQFGERGVSTVCAGIRSILNRKLRFDNMDLVYAAGLYDYLEAPVATRLTARMFSMLRSGGRVLVANFQPSLPDIGGMETMMRWKLIYRDPKQMAEVAAEIDPAQIASSRLFPDEHGNLIFLELTRK